MGAAAQQERYERRLELHPQVHFAVAFPALGEMDGQLDDLQAGEAIQVMPMTPGEFGQFIQADIARWSALARERNIRLDD